MPNNPVIEAIQRTVYDTNISPEAKLVLLKEALDELEECIDTLSGDMVE